MRAIKAAAALMAVAAILIGPPWLLIQIGWPLPDHVPTFEEVRATVTRPPSDLLVLNTLALLGWGLWAALIRALAVELWVQTRTTPRTTGTRSTSGHGPLRWIAAVLIAAVIATGPAAAVATPAEASQVAVAAPVDPADEQQPHSAAVSVAASETDPRHAQQEDSSEVVHTVEKGDTLWDIAADQDYLGDPERYTEIFAANEGEIQDDGRSLEDADLIYPGWELTIPIAGEDTEGDAEQATPQEEASPEEDDSANPSEEASAPTEQPESEAPTSPPIGDDGVAPTQPEQEEEDTARPTESASPTTEPIPTDSAEAPPGNGAAESTSDSSPAGLWITAGTFLGLGVAFSLLVLAKRRRDRAAPEDDDNAETLTGRLADLETLFGADAEPQRSDTVLPLATTYTPGPGEASILDWAADGLGLTGPGAPAAVRAAILTASASHVPLVITREAAEMIGLDPVEHPSHLAITADLEDAIDVAEARIEDPVFDLAVGRADLPPLILITESLGPHTDRLTEVLAHDLIGALILGPWESAQIALAPDGTVTAHQPPEVGLEDLKHCYIADETTFVDLLTATDDPLETDQGAEPVNPLEDEKTRHAPEPSGEAATDAPEPAPATIIATESAGSLRLTLLGRPTLTWNDQPIQWRRRKSLLLLTALALNPDGRTLDDLLETVVGDSHVDKARGHLATITSDTRRDVRDATGLDIRVVLHDSQTNRYRLHETVTVDLHEFDQHRRVAATVENDQSCRAHLEAILHLYGGDFASGYDDDWLDEARFALKRAVYSTCLHLAVLYRDTDDLPAAIAVLERATALDRARPNAWTALAETHESQGDTAAAEKARQQLRLWGTPVHNTAPM